MSAYMCFPVSVQALPASSPPLSAPQIDLLATLAGRLIDLASAASRGAGKVQLQTPTPSKDPAAIYQLSETQRAQLAADSQTPASILLALAVDEFSSVRIEVMYNKALPLQGLKLLARDEDRFIAAQARALLQVAA